MQGRELGKRLEPAEDVVVDQYRLAEADAAMHEALGDRGYVIWALRDEATDEDESSSTAESFRSSTRR